MKWSRDHVLTWTYSSDLMLTVDVDRLKDISSGGPAIIPWFLIWPTFQSHRGQSSSAHLVTIWPRMLQPSKCTTFVSTNAGKHPRWRDVIWKTGTGRRSKATSPQFHHTTYEKRAHGNFRVQGHCTTILPCDTPLSPDTLSLQKPIQNLDLFYSYKFNKCRYREIYERLESPPPSHVSCLYLSSKLHIMHRNIIFLPFYSSKMHVFDSYSKIPWYRKLLYQRENALASFWVQRVLVTQPKPSRVDDFSH
jgi:hypothetical protein